MHDDRRELLLGELKRRHDELGVRLEELARNDSESKPALLAIAGDLLAQWRTIGAHLLELDAAPTSSGGPPRPDRRPFPVRLWGSLRFRLHRFLDARRQRSGSVGPSPQNAAAREAGTRSGTPSGTRSQTRSRSRRFEAPTEDAGVLVVLEEALDTPLAAFVGALGELVGRRATTPEPLAVLSLHGPREPLPELWAELSARHSAIPLGCLVGDDELPGAAAAEVATRRRIVYVGSGRSERGRAFLERRPRDGAIALLHPWGPEPTGIEGWTRVRWLDPAAGLVPEVARAVLPDRAEARRRLDLPDDGPVVGQVTDLIPPRRPEDFVLLARRWSDRRATFVLAGAGPLEPDVLRLADRLDLPGSRFRLLDPSAGPLVLGAADLVVGTSEEEPFPLHLLRALPTRPVLRPAGTSLPDSPSDAAAAPGDVEALLRNLEAALATSRGGSAPAPVGLDPTAFAESVLESLEPG